MNAWSNGKVIKIPVHDHSFDFQEVEWRGKVITVEFELFKMLVKDCMDRYGWSRDQALDELVLDMD